MSIDENALQIRFEPQDVFEVVNPKGQGKALLLCEHASSQIPKAFNDLGLATADRYSHAAWDIGAFDVAQEMAILLDATLVAGRLSRLIYDLNRPPEADDNIPSRSERIEIPGNRGVGLTEKEGRIGQIHDVFHSQVAQIISQRADRAQETVIVSIHSFTPVYNGMRRATRFGFLHDDDASFAEACLEASKKMGIKDCALNAPYSQADGVTYSLNRHGTKNDLDAAMIEVRSDLVDNPTIAKQVAHRLTMIVVAAIEMLQAPKCQAVQ